MTTTKPVDNCMVVEMGGLLEPVTTLNVSDTNHTTGAFCVRWRASSLPNERNACNLEGFNLARFASLAALRPSNRTQKGGIKPLLGRWPSFRRGAVCISRGARQILKALKPAESVRFNWREAPAPEDTTARQQVPNTVEHVDKPRSEQPESTQLT